MLAYMNKEAYEKTLSTGKMTYWSRSRDELWVKGDTSGHYQYVKSLTADCDKDTILAKVSQTGAACHTGEYSCFFNKIMEKEDAKTTNPLKVFEDVFAVIMTSPSIRSAAMESSSTAAVRGRITAKYNTRRTTNSTAITIMRVFCFFMNVFS